mgnify:CR=1 FL=1
MTQDVRALAAGVLLQVLSHGRSLDQVLPEAQASLTDARDGALLQELCYGTIRWYFRLDAILRQLLDLSLIHI